MLQQQQKANISSSALVIFLSLFENFIVIFPYGCSLLNVKFGNIWYILSIFSIMCAQISKYSERRGYKNPYWTGQTLDISYPLHSIGRLLLHYDINHLITGTLGWNSCFSVFSVIFSYYNGAEIRAQQKEIIKQNHGFFLWKGGPMCETGRISKKNAV